MKMLCNVGVNDMSGVSHTKEYKLWAGVINRCHNELFHKNKLSYAKCWVYDDFLTFSNFHNWCQNQIGFNKKGFDLDKDLLEKGNKEYHPDKCVFIPREINLFIRAKKASKRAISNWRNNKPPWKLHTSNINKRKKCTSGNI